MPNLSCILFEVVVYSNLYVAFGLAILKQALAARAPSWKPDNINLSLPGYVHISPIANIPSLFVWKVPVFTGTVFFF